MNVPNSQQPDSSDDAEQIFLDALDVDQADRDAFVRERCGENEDLRTKVAALLRADEEAEKGFLNEDFLNEDFLNEDFLNAGPADDPAPKEPTPSQVQGSAGDQDTRFKILGKHRSGGLGDVYVAVDRQLGREVALKQIRGKWSDHVEARRRFIQEAEVTGRLEHPGIVPVYAMGTWPNGESYYAMRFIEGDTLAESIKAYHHSRDEADDSEDRQTARLKLRELLSVFIDVCNTIQYAHAKQVLHRDIKPSNIMVGPYGETLVVDWGLAKMLDVPTDQGLTENLMMVDSSGSGSGSTETRVGGRVGTPQYMSPEQATGRLDEISKRTDVYLLGATLYQILTGSAPHTLSDECPTLEQLLKRIGAGTVTPPTMINANVAPPLEAICMKAMAEFPSNRYRKASHLADDVRRYLADESVTVHEDSWGVRAARWIRRHQAATYSMAVAMMLVTVGSIVGSAIWNRERAKQFEISRERNIKTAALSAAKERRLLGLRSSATAALDLATQEQSADRFSSALRLLRGAMEPIRDEPELSDQLAELTSRSDRMERVVSFYRFADQCRLHNTSSEDAEAIVTCVASLEALGVWDKDDWWFRLPDQDLSPAQADDLRQEVYQQLMVLDALLVKTIATRLAGADRIGTGRTLLPSLIRFLRTDIGKREAAAAVVISDRLDRFRLSESARWYRSVADYRLGNAMRLKADELGLTKNAADAQSLGVLCMIAGLDPAFERLFRGYGGDDPLLAAQDLFGRASTERPQSYWTQLSLAQVDFLIADRDEDPSWRKYDRAIQTIGRCIAIDDRRSIAFADRSSMYRYQARAIARDDSLETEYRNALIGERRRWSLADALRAQSLGSKSPGESGGRIQDAWVGWQVGLALHEVGQDDRAMEMFLETSILTHSIADLTDVMFVGADDLRGREEAAELAIERTQSDPQDLRGHVLLASIRLNQNRVDQARDSVITALEQDSALPEALAIRGMIRMRTKQYAEAGQDFAAVLSQDANHPWAAFGRAASYEAMGETGQAMQAYQDSLAVMRTAKHEAAAHLGYARTAAMLGMYDDASAAIETARRLAPASDLTRSMKPLAVTYGKLKSKSPDAPELVPLKEFLTFIAKLPRVSRIEVPSAPLSGYRAALLNGGFELAAMRYWSDDSGATWGNAGDYQSSGRLTPTSAYRGARCLHIRSPATLASDQIGSTGQTIPLDAGGRYRITLAAKSESTDADTVRVRVDGNPVLTIPEGTYPWTQVSAEFDLPTDDDDREVIVPVRVDIVASGSGQVWLDEIQVWKLADEGQ